MNREQRRKFNKKNKTNYTKEQFDLMLAIERLKHGNLDFRGLNLPHDFVHMDNTELVPEGTVCKLNYQAIKNRFDKNSAGYQEGYKEWVEQHREEEFHVTREFAQQSCVCLKEQVEKADEEGLLKFLWDLYSDLLFQDAQGEWKPLSQIDPNMNTYLEVDMDKVKSNN